MRRHAQAAMLLGLDPQEARRALEELIVQGVQEG